MTSQKKNEEKRRIYRDCPVYEPDMIDENDPVVRRKREEAKRAWAELGFDSPEFFLKWQDKQQG